MSQLSLYVHAMTTEAVTVKETRPEYLFLRIIFRFEHED